MARQAIALSPSSDEWEHSGFAIGDTSEVLGEIEHARNDLCIWRRDWQRDVAGELEAIPRSPLIDERCSTSAYWMSIGISRAAGAGRPVNMSETTASRAAPS